MIFPPAVANFYVIGLENSDQSNARFKRFVLSIIALMVCIRTNSKTLYNFIIDIFPVSCKVFEIGTLTPLFASRWSCKRSHRAEHWHFIIPGHQVCGNSCRRSQVNVGWEDLSGQPVRSASICQKFHFEASGNVALLLVSARCFKVFIRSGKYCAIIFLFHVTVNKLVSLVKFLLDGSPALPYLTCHNFQNYCHGESQKKS
ncbi:hypothetical protein AVEN_209243-1 [Araneus ventricosus]|uniref:Uncharacterized protein n=1 Tax=Araneus ventricosus TaxID=182803 RepID=A0A4Y2SFT8_ARAVE|nr:hypothetical protein AVEN_209243-1 [Araneus ventricosus]